MRIEREDPKKRNRLSDDEEDQEANPLLSEYASQSTTDSGIIPAGDSAGSSME